MPAAKNAKPAPKRVLKTKPVSIKIGHRDIPILDMHQHESEGHQMLGVFFVNGGPIQIDTTRSPTHQGEILFHEVMHAIWHDRAVPGDEETEEQIVSAISRGFAAAIRDNPHFLDLLRLTLIEKKSLNLTKG